MNAQYDGPQGWYAGAMLGDMRFGEQRRSPLLLGYAGRVFPLATGLDAEAGATYTHFSGVPGYDYSEAYAGLIAERWHGRLYYSGNYFDRQQRSLYAELGGNVSLRGDETIQAFGQLGALGQIGGANTGTRGRTRLDLRAGAAWRHGAGQLSLAWVTAGRGGPYSGSYGGPRNACVLGALWAF